MPKVTHIAAVVFLVSVVCMASGGLYAIWGNTAFGLKVLLTALIFAILSVIAIALGDV